MPEALVQLLGIMPAPQSPRAAMGDWSMVISTLGTALPGDYVDFINCYGTGCISQFLWIHNPFEANVHLCLLSRYSVILDADLDIRTSFPEEIPQPLFPEPGGLLPFATTDNGDRIYWLTKGAPESWTVVVWESRGPHYAEFAMTMTRFLCGWLGGNLHVPMFSPADWQPIFEQNPSYFT